MDWGGGGRVRAAALWTWSLACSGIFNLRRGEPDLVAAVMGDFFFFTGSRPNERKEGGSVSDVGEEG